MAGRSGGKEVFWRNLLAKYDSRRETIRGFCQRQGVSERAFYRWREKLPPGRVASQPAFQPVFIQPVAAATPTIEVKLPGGRRLLLRPGFDAATLRQLLDVLEAQPPRRSSC